VAHCPADGGAPEIVDTLPAGARLGVYRIDRILGEGGMGFVYEATHEVLSRRTAIKMLRPELAKTEKIVTRFLNEAKAVNLIDHQNVVSIYDYGDGADGSVYFVMELLEGETLDDLMRKRQPMQVPLLLHVFAQIARALAAVHAKRIVHRDLKPTNVFVVAREDNPYFIKLLDFGVAQLRGEGAVQGLTLAGSIMGTPQYMSPEQISGGTVDARTDVWALGVMLYRAATGHAPFKGGAFAELADKICHHDPVPASELVPLSGELAKLIASCLQRRVEDRCPSVTDFMAGLERVKRECKLDDDAILAAAKADSRALDEDLPTRQGQLTREEIGGSRPEFQGGQGGQGGPGGDVHELRPNALPPRRSRLGRYVAIGALVSGLASAGFMLFGRGAEHGGAPRPSDGSGNGSQARSAPAPGTPQAPDPPKPSLADAFEAGDMARVRALAEQHLREAIGSGTLQQKGFAVDALALAHTPAGAKLLYLALKGPPDVRVKAARALGELGLPDAAPRLRDALAESGDKLKVEIAAALYRLGDKDVRVILKRATEEPATRLTAALAMADAGDAAGRAVLADVLQTLDEARADSWRLAARGLLELGDAAPRKALEAELAQPDATRSVGAAELLARAGDARAREQLARNTADEDFTRRGEAAVALARLGDQRALGWVARGVASPDDEERKLALAVCGRLAAHAATHTGAIAKLAADDPNESVRMTAEAVLLGL
jgi:HEAT repeat protein/tRNA A-37 threonylcarbamoyl transferase component Bud32